MSLPAYLWNELEKVAEEEERSVSNLVRWIVVRYLKEREGDEATRITVEHKG